MIVIRLMGGLGNQMHQFAYGTYLQHVQNREVVYGTASFASDPLRDFALSVWNIDPEFVTPKIRQRCPRKVGGKGWKNYLWGSKPLAMVRQRPWQFHARYHALPSDAFCEGYWQGEPFFPGIRDRLLDCFQPAGVLSSSTRELTKRVEATTSVAIHVRRTDFLTIPFMQVCTVDYYRAAIGQLQATTPGLELFVFSDDIAWCREHLQFASPTHYIDRDAPAHEDLWLMSRCAHHVIPNSSFGWWGAWLSQRGGQVFAPDPWFADPKLGGGDIVPMHWNRFDVNRLAMRSAAA